MLCKETGVLQIPRSAILPEGQRHVLLLCIYWKISRSNASGKEGGMVF